MVFDIYRAVDGVLGKVPETGAIRFYHHDCIGERRYDGALPDRAAQDVMICPECGERVTGAAP